MNTGVSCVGMSGEHPLPGSVPLRLVASGAELNFVLTSRSGPKCSRAGKLR